ncbi:hypothetical protein [Tropicimonas aquimaris]|uniref:ABC transporter permease n=1 Tax=Tropicimonas aquimaris TaxID=914152 RepID=A0ABW3IR23_9RHOB
MTNRFQGIAGRDAGPTGADGAFRRPLDERDSGAERLGPRLVGRNLIEKTLIPLLVALASFLAALIGIAVYQFGAGAEVLTIAIGNWMTALAICILVLLGVLAVLSDVNAP